MTNLTAKDLRIGNWIKSNIYQQVTVEILDFLSNSNFDHSKAIHPIPLTPSILEAAGFVKNKGWNEYCWKGDFTINEVNGGFEVFASEWTIGKTFNFVHELQNISFILFGIELTINLNQLQQA